MSEEKTVLFDTLCDNALKKAETIKDEFAREAAKTSIKLFKENREALKDVGQDILARIVGNISIGNIDEARLLYIKQVATADELIKGVADSADKILQGDAKFREQAKRIDSVLKKISQETAKYLLPLILGVV